MSSLRRDLFERKLWLVLVVLVAAIVAVPFLLLKNSSAGGTPEPLPPAAAAAAAQEASASAHAKTVPTKVLLASMPRDPFAAGEPKLSSQPSAATGSTASTSTSGTAAAGATTGSATTTQAAMVSPSPAAHSAGAGAASSGTASSSSSSSTTTSSSSTTSNSATTAAVPTTPSTPTATPAWTIYSVSVRFGKNATVPVRTNLAWLAPFPVDQPVAMFMGVLSGGQQAVFALASGIGHTGPGLCRPNHDMCSEILLKAGETERLAVPTSSGGEQHLILRVVRIGSTVTHSRKVALAAYDRYSAAGICDLGGQAPVLYDPQSGTVQNVPRATCSQHRASNLFSYPQVNP